MTLIDKNQVFAKVLTKLEGNLEVLVQAAFQAKADSTNEESKAENKYDTRGLEASYLASGQAQRAQDLQEQIYQLKKVNIKSYKEDEPIGIAAIVEYKTNNATKYAFMLPVGGVEVELMQIKFQTLTIEAPLGKLFLGLTSGSDFEIKGRYYEILSVQ